MVGTVPDSSEALTTSNQSEMTPILPKLPLRGAKGDSEPKRDQSWPEPPEARARRGAGPPFPPREATPLRELATPRARSRRARAAFRPFSSRSGAAPASLLCDGPD